MTCPKCGFENQGGAVFCAKCATKLISVTRTLETTPEGLGKGELFAGRFELIEELGAGGMGIVYRAYDKEVGEEIALKVLHPDIALDEKTVDRFRNEIKLARRITHKNVCRMHELHQDEKELFITMEYVSGQDLKGLIKESGALAAGKAISIAKQICEGLAEAHDLGVIHRDLKPQNIMVNKEGNAKIMDFGIARSLRTAGMTAEGMIIGTPEYMAPEQVEGLEADQRTDIYALGAIIFEMVTGRVPFEGDSPLSVAYKHKNEAPIPPRKINFLVPEPLNGLILRCLEKEKDNRYQTADEVLADLVRIEDGLPISERVILKARPTIHITRDKPPGVKRFLVPALALLVLAVGAAAVWRFLLHPAEPALANTENSIAVISFENQTGDKALEKYREIIPDLLITSLGQTSLSVTSAERLRDVLKQVGKGDIEFVDSDLGFEVCRKDGVKSLVTGSFYRAGNTLITDVKVLDVRTKRLLRTAKAQGQGPESVFSTQVDELSRQIASGLGVSQEKIDASLRPIAEVSTKSEEAYEYRLQGSKDLDNMQYTKARESLEKAVKLDPEYAFAQSELAYAYFGEGNTPAFKQALEKALSLSKNAPEKERLIIEGAYAHDIERNRDKWAAIVKELAAKYPKEKDFHSGLAYIYSESDPERAIKEYNIALSLDPDQVAGLNNLGLLYVKRKEFTKGLEILKRLVTAAPEKPNALDSLAEAYFQAGMIAEAKATWRKLLERWPDWPCTQLQYIAVLEEDYGEALRLWDKYLAACTPQNTAGGYMWKAFIRGWLGDFDGSLTDLQRAEEMFAAIDEKAFVISIRRLRPWLNLDQHRLELSRESLENFRAYGLKTTQSPQGPALYEARHEEMLGYIECEEGKADSAERRLKAMEALIPTVALNPTTGAANQHALKYEADWLRAEIRLAQGRFDTVIEVLKKAPPGPEPKFEYWGISFILHNCPFLRDAVARAYAKKGDISKAIAEYERLTTFDPKSDEHYLIHPKYHYRLGLLYEQKGQKAKAAERYRKFLGLWKDADPGMPEIADATKRLAALS